ncbi:MAG: hypothetical protein J0L67_01070 [Cytophagales bacterium]|nr:hypothetical protein [Cytophagales bacterium]
MRKFLIVLAALALVIGCRSAKVRMNNCLEKVYLGMSVEDFKKIASKSTLVQAIDGFSCYKLEEQSAKFGEPGGYVYERRFFLF